MRPSYIVVVCNVATVFAACVAPRTTSPSRTDSETDGVVRARRLEIVDNAGRVACCMEPGMLSLESPPDAHQRSMMFGVRFHELEDEIRATLVMQAHDASGNKVGMGVMLSYDGVNLMIYDDKGQSVKLELVQGAPRVVRQVSRDNVQSAVFEPAQPK